jgi:hypothetical protein
MTKKRVRSLVLLALVLLLADGSLMAQQTSTKPEWAGGAIKKMEADLSAKYGDAQHSRIVRGLKQVSDLWTSDDGSQQAFEEFVRNYFAGDQATLDALFERLQYNLEQIDGHSQEISRELRQPADLDLGPTQPIDEIFGGYDITAHLTDDLFANKIAFVVLLNFPLTTLDERLSDGEKWSRREWAEARLAQRFSKRIPADVNLGISKAIADSDLYISNYNIWMHHVLDEQGKRLFPAGMRLLTHWNLRDQIKADYADKENGLAKQRVMQKVMERIVTQTIPASVIDKPNVDWNPFTNTVKASTVNDSKEAVIVEQGSMPLDAPEPDTRYAKLLANYKALRRADPYSPTSPTYIETSFNDYREIPESRVRQIFDQVLTSPQVSQVAALIAKRLGRPLEPFDIWYDGFRARSAYGEEQLNEIVSKRDPTAAEYKNDIPNLLTQLDFTKEKADYVAANIMVDPARGSGHAMASAMRSSKVHLRTRVGKSGMDYKGFNIAVHEMGHNVEQTFSLNNIDYYTLRGVPNNAFTEALAFVFQEHDLELLGLAKPTAESQALTTLSDLWGTFEISGVALVDMGVWHWMYDHPDATPAELKQATIQISKDVWNKYYAPVFKTRDVVLLGIYSHMIDNPLYLPDYPIGHMIAYQIKEQMNKAGKIGPEFERMSVAGNIAPDLWMKKATGGTVSPAALLTATEKALGQVK